MKPICVPCKRFFRPAKNGYPFGEGMPKHNGARPGLQEPKNWEPYKLWMGDLWRCEGCGAQIVVGVGHRPIAEHYQDGFKEQIEAHGVIVQVNDC